MSNQTEQSENRMKRQKTKTKNKNKTIYKYTDIYHSVKRGRRCKNINPKHKEYVTYDEPQLCRVEKTAGACGPKCSRGHRPMCRRLVLGARVSLSWLITGVLWYLWLDVVFFVGLGCVCRIARSITQFGLRVGV
jgi:hypothetical protein